jgi:hypothetical protein
VSGSIGLVVVLLLLAAALAWIFLGTARPSGGESARTARRRVADPDELTAAEDEVRDLDALASPDDAAEELPDWGPGSPKP